MPRPRLLTFLALALGAQAACSGALAPAADEPLPVTHLARPPVAGERLPAVEVEALENAITVTVSQSALPCGLVAAHVGRTQRRIVIAARLHGDPLSLCAGDMVDEYSGVVGNLPRGWYQVRVYQAIGDGDYQLIGRESVYVGPSAD